MIRSTVSPASALRISKSLPSTKITTTLNIRKMLEGKELRIEVLPETLGEHLTRNP